ncbi:MAG: RNase adapter RapZ [Clostridia bacterium]|nr:RNase adapter RapZ [Clostridia bacterium]
MEFLILTGVSGAGKTRTMHTLEDMGFYCVDNLPPELIGTFCELCEKSGTQRAVVVTDVRGGSFFSSFEKALDDLRRAGKTFKVLFLDATDQVLINRYKETRRRHPFAERCMGSLAGAVAMERQLLERVRESADYLIDTSDLSPVELQNKINSLFLFRLDEAMVIHCSSFGFKHGLPREADLVFDVRFLPNPFYVEDLKHKTGLDQPVYDFVMQNPIAEEFVSRWTTLVDFLIPQYVKEGKTELRIAVGCTGGHHRSVALTSYLYHHLLDAGYRVDMNHRDIHK